MNRPLHLCVETWNVTVVRRWVEIALQEDIDNAIEIPSPIGTALCMAAALKKEREIGNLIELFFNELLISIPSIKFSYHYHCCPNYQSSPVNLGSSN